ncbi:DUF6804 family protein [Sinorhizobium fredii]|uniref:DUF6804 family protein n=1 Tax=Rhizobium fredii TaxID=380 RepID=UPI003515E00F
MSERPAIYLLIPAALLLVAVLPLPYGYYIFLRLVVTVGAALAAYSAYKAKASISGEVVVMGLMAILFNPLVPVMLSRSVWLPIDLLAGCIFAYVALRKGTTAAN